MERLLLLLLVSLSLSSFGSDYNAGSLERLAPERTAPSTPILPEDPSLPPRARLLLKDLIYGLGPKRFEAAFLLASAVEMEARSGVTSFFGRERAQQDAAEEKLRVILTSRTGILVPEKTRTLVFKLLEDRFLTRGQYAAIFAEYELDRRNKIALDTSSRAPVNQTEAMKNFRAHLGQALYLPLKERASVKAFWFATENAFNNLEKDCGTLNKCESRLKELVDFLSERSHIDVPTAEKLYALYQVRVVSRSELRDLMAQRPQKERIASRPMRREVMSAGMIAAESLAGRWVGENSDASTFPRFFLFTLFFFALGIGAATRMSYRN